MMKTILLSILTLFSLTVSAQSITNYDFENWTTDNVLPGWSVRNSSVLPIFNAVPTVSKSTVKFSGSFAIKVQNSKGSYTTSLGAKKDTLFGGLVTTEVSIKGKKAPALLKGHINYSLAVGETAEISISYKKSLSNGFRTRLEAIKQFTGNSGGSFIPFNIPINPYYHPDRFSDTLFVTITSYQHEATNSHPVSELSNVIVDSLGFYGTMPAVEVPAIGTILNGGFENWTTVGNTKIADNWHSYGTAAVLGNDKLQQSTDFHSGTYAMKIVQDHVSPPGVLYTLTRATAETKYINGYAKYNLATDSKDTLFVSVFKLSKENFGSIVFASKKFVGTQPYQPFSLKLDNTVMPNDTLLILFYYYAISPPSNSVSTFLLDDVQISSFPLGIEDELNSLSSISVSPNPSSSGIFYLNAGDKVKGFKVFNALGTEIESRIVKGEENARIDISQNPRGIYFLYSEDKQNFRLVY